MTSKPIIPVTHQQMVDFINSQPDDKVVDFNQIKYSSVCGCIMIQYAKEHKFIPRGPGVPGVGVHDFLDEDNHRLDLPFSRYIPGYKDEMEDVIFTYKELKDHVNGK